MDAYTVCPHCGFEEPSNDACSRCGIVFQKFYEHQASPPAHPQSNANEQAIIVEFQQRRAFTTAGLLLLILVGPLLVCVGARCCGDDPSLAWYWVSLFISFAAVFSVILNKYRCPACDQNAFFGTPQILNPVFCAGCGARLQGPSARLRSAWLGAALITAVCLGVMSIVVPRTLPSFVWDFNSIFLVLFYVFLTFVIASAAIQARSAAHPTSAKVALALIARPQAQSDRIIVAAAGLLAVVAILYVFGIHNQAVFAAFVVAAITVLVVVWRDLTLRATQLIAGTPKVSTRREKEIIERFQSERKRKVKISWRAGLLMVVGGLCWNFESHTVKAIGLLLVIGAFFWLLIESSRPDRDLRCPACGASMSDGEGGYLNPVFCGQCGTRLK